MFNTKRPTFWIKITGIFLLSIFKIFQIEWLYKFSSNWLHQLDILANFGLFILILDIIRKAIFQWHRTKKGLRKSEFDNLISGVNNIFAIILVMAFAITGLSMMGIDVPAFVASLSIIAAAIAVVSKDYLSNIIGGMLLAFSNDVSIGDRVKIGDHKGKVLDITIAKFFLLSSEDDIIILPNNTVYTANITNYTKRLIRKTSIDFEMDWLYIRPVPELEAAIVDAINEFQNYIQPDSYDLHVVEMKKDLVSFQFQYILKLPDRDLERKIRKQVIRHIIHMLKAHQINKP